MKDQNISRLIKKLLKRFKAAIKSSKERQKKKIKCFDIANVASYSLTFLSLSDL